jgi:hypothetical protein
MLNRLDSRHRAEQAERMHATGATWQEVADTLGYRSRQGAQTAVARLRDSTPPETMEQARAKHDGALRLLLRNNFTRYLNALQAGDDDTAAKYSKEIRGTVAERARLGGAYAPQRTEVDVNVRQSATAILDRAEADLLALAQPDAIDAEVIE